MTGSARFGTLTQAQRDRLAYIDLRVRFLGSVNRAELMERFGNNSATSTRDLSAYRRRAIHNLEYVPRHKHYVRVEDRWFRPLFEVSAHRVLLWLTEGVSDGDPASFRGLMAHAAISHSQGIDLEALSVITRSIHQRRAVDATYLGRSSGRVRRQIVPHALVAGGARWYVRGFDRGARQFRDFSLARFQSAQFLEDDLADPERPSEDAEWHRMIDLELVAHPVNVQHPESIRAEYAMDRDVLRIRARAAVVGYWLNHLRADCSEDHSLRGAEFVLWMRNPHVLYGVANRTLAPGYAKPISV